MASTCLITIAAHTLPFIGVMKYFTINMKQTADGMATKRATYVKEDVWSAARESETTDTTMTVIASIHVDALTAATILLNMISVATKIVQ
jgi:hypothetical protein